MGIYYGDIHYGARITEVTEVEGYIEEELVLELLFINNGTSLDTYIDQIKSVFSTLSGTAKYKYELYVDIITTFDANSCQKGWQIVSGIEMNKVISGKYKIGFLNV